ncbi:uncharacterized protein H6S33_004483 [Morchella sextelata]|uniref:uncharacterized protein n=1 Tax=Morchella sextelata TaxID=1174677 RepID=UPI001D056B38|nr:uncharacterized protein H6S33_004483 [Morchella sextelata]KAH0606026.1 hypothetical protein H6S33_004483 [Morchella sextelata]
MLRIFLLVFTAVRKWSGKERIHIRPESRLIALFNPFIFCSTRFNHGNDLQIYTSLSIADVRTWGSASQLQAFIQSTLKESVKVGFMIRHSIIAKEGMSQLHVNIGLLGFYHPKPCMRISAGKLEQKTKEAPLNKRRKKSLAALRGRTATDDVAPVALYLFSFGDRGTDWAAVPGLMIVHHNGRYQTATTEEQRIKDLNQSLTVQMDIEPRFKVVGELNKTRINCFQSFPDEANMAREIRHLS